MGAKELEEALELGMDYSLREGYGRVHAYAYRGRYAWAEDKEHCEEYGRMLQVPSRIRAVLTNRRTLPRSAAVPSAAGCLS